MKKLLSSLVVASAAFMALAGTSHADVNPKMLNSKYCRDYPYDVICMGPQMLAMRAAIMAMTKEKAMEARSNYCRSSAAPNDPICDPKMMTDTTGY